MLTIIEPVKIPNLTRQANTIITTSVGHRENLVAAAQSISEELDAPYYPRLHKGLPWLFTTTGAERAVVVESSGLALIHRNGPVYRYHPNLGLIRLLNMLRGQRDLFADSVELNPGESILDCTVGFGCEAILASLIVGETGRVVGLESTPELALVTRRGLKTRVMTQDRLNSPMRRIEIVCADYRNYLNSIKRDEFDVIYFDPFFHERIDGSEINIDPLMTFGNSAPLDVDSVVKAIDLAKKRVVVKHPRNHALPGNLESLRSDIIFRRHGPIAYSVFGRR